MKVSVVLPTYNERENIVLLIRELLTVLKKPKCNPQILVVDDNSPDGTARVVHQKFKKQKNVQVFTRKKERGLATAIRYGIERAGGDVIAVMDTDFNHDPKLLPSFLNKLKNYDFVIGSRFVNGGGMENKTRELFSRIFNILVRFLTGNPVHDNLSGFFAIKREILNKLSFNKIFFGYGEYFIRLIYLARNKGATFSEIPSFYYNRKYGASKSKFLQMFWDYLLAALKITSSNIDYLTTLLINSPAAWALIRANEIRTLEKVNFIPPVLDIGCGDGLVAKVILESRNIDKFDVGLDISEREIKKAQKSGSYKKCVAGDVYNLPFSDNSFQTVFSNSTIEHLNNLDRGLSEIFRVLKSHGQLIITVPTSFFSGYLLGSRFFSLLGLNVIARWYARFFHFLVRHRNIHNHEQWAKILHNHQLILIDYYYYHQPSLIQFHELLSYAAIPQHLVKLITGKWPVFPKLRKILLVPWLKNLFYKLYDSKLSKREGGSLLLVAIKK